jgi:PAP2 superfamily
MRSWMFNPRLAAGIYAFSLFLICFFIVAVPSNDFAFSPFIGWGYLGAVPFQIRARRSWFEILPTLGMAGIFLLFSPLALTSVLAAFGTSSIAMLMYRRQCGELEFSSLAIPAALPPIILLVNLVQAPIIALTPHPLDALLHRVDAQFGFNPSELAMSFQHHWSYAIVGQLYMALPFAVAIVLSLSDSRKTLARALIVCAVLTIPCYLLLPGVGPAHVGEPDFDVSPRNCVPSAHLVWALLLFWNSNQRGLRYFTAFFVLATIAGTMVTGEHYLIDLVLAFPFALAVQALSAERRRLAVASAASLVTLIGITAILYFEHIPMLPLISFIIAAAGFTLGDSIGKDVVVGLAQES